MLTLIFGTLWSLIIKLYNRLALSFSDNNLSFIWLDQEVSIMSTYIPQVIHLQDLGAVCVATMAAIITDIITIPVFSTLTPNANIFKLD